MASKKVLAALLILTVAIAVVATLIVVDFQGWGASLAGAGGPIAHSIYTGLNSIPIFISSGGWPSLIIGITLCVVFPMLLASYITWHYNVPVILHLSSAEQSKITGYNAQRAPEEPETLTTTKAVK